MVISNVLDNIILFYNIILIFTLIYSSTKDILLRKKFGPNNFKFYRLGPYSLQSMKKAQFMNICHYVPIRATLQIYSRLTPMALIATTSTYRK